jgi:hypothetical protein
MLGAAPHHMKTQRGVRMDLPTGVAETETFYAARFALARSSTRIRARQAAV